VSNIKHIIFDCDGVLVDTEYTAAIKMTEALNKLGASVTVDHYLRNLSGATFSSIVTKYFNNSLAAREVTKIITKVEDQVAEDLKLIEGVAQLLNNLHLGKSVVSNSSLRTVEHALRSTGIYDQFGGGIFSSEYVEKPKPAPDIYLLALKSIPVNISEILVVEDSLSGAKAALSAGFRVIGFTGGGHILPGHQQKLEALGVHKVCRTMDILGNYLSIVLAH